MRIDRRTALGFVLVATLLPGAAFALERDERGWYTTGNGVRKKKVGPFSAEVYSITHFMRELPPSRSKAAVIAAETDKAFVWQTLRDLDASQITNALRDAYAMNGYGDRPKIDAFLAAFTKKEPKGTKVQITYAAGPKTTTLKVSNDGTATIPGSDFMRATWSIWFGKIDQPSLGDDLIKNIPATAGA
jgi:hypothetical protein